MNARDCSPDDPLSLRAETCRRCPDCQGCERHNCTRGQADFYLPRSVRGCDFFSCMSVGPFPPYVHERRRARVVK